MVPWQLTESFDTGDGLVRWSVLGDGPPVVLTHGTPGDLGPPLEEIWQELQVAQSQLSPRGRLIVARKSGHHIHNDQPRLVFRAIVQVVAWSRHNAG